MFSRLKGQATRCLAWIMLLSAPFSGFAQDWGTAPTVPYLLPPATEVTNTLVTEEDLRTQLQSLQDLYQDLASAESKRSEAEQEKKQADAKKPTLEWSGQVQDDFYWFDQDAANRAEFGDIQNGNAFRRARFGMFGDYGPSEYRIEMDFALAGRPSFLDVYAGLHDLPGIGRLRVGHFFEPFSLERMTPNRYTTFMERSLIDQPFAPARNNGIMANNTWLDANATWAAGFFRSDSDAFGDEVGDNFEQAVTARTTLLPYYDCEGRQYIHLGSAYSIRGTDGGVASFSSQPEARIGAASPNVPFFVDTGAIPADFFQLAGLEAAWVNGSLSLQSEYAMTSVNADDGTSPMFHGWYAMVSYFLTGEHRPYRRDIGVFDRVIPRHDLLSYAGRPEDKCLCFGPGAWEVAFRVSHLNLNDETVIGGEQTDLTAGINWYLNPYLRVTANYVHAFVESSAGVDSDADIFATRVGFDF